MATDLFAPPTKDELDLFAPPSEDELAGVKPRVVKSLGDTVPGEKEGVDYVFDKPAGRPTQQPSLPRLIGGGVDAAQAMARNVPVEMARSAARLLGLPKLGDQMRNTFTAHPFSEAGRDIQGEIGQGIQAAISPWVEGGGRLLDATGIPNMRQDVGRLLGTAGDIANVAPAFGLLGRSATLPVGPAVEGATVLKPRMVAPSAEAVTTSRRAREAGAVAPVAKAAGFDVTPSSVAGSRGVEPKGLVSHMEGPTRAPEASLRNAQQLNRRFADEKGIRVDADGRIEPQAYDEARLPAFGVYDEARAFPGGQNPEYTTAVLNAIKGVEVPTEAAPEVARLMQRYSAVGDSGQLVEDLKNLRRTAAKRREGDTANQVSNEAIADVQMAIADELENELGRRAAAAGDAGFQQRLKDARFDLAQLYEAERATTGGFLDAKALAARQRKTGRLTGNLQLGAEMAENMPDVFQHPQSAARAVSMGQRTPEAWGTRSFLFRTGERLGGGALSRRAMRKYNEQIPVGPDALERFNILPVRDRGFPSPMGPNMGPQPGPQPPQAPPGLFAAEPPAPRAPGMPSAGRPEPGQLPFNQSLADLLAGDLTLEGQLPPAPVRGAPQSRPLDTVDFERGAPPAPPGVRQVQPPGDPVATVDRMSYEGQPGNFADMLNPDILPWEPPGAVPPLQGPRMSLADQLGPVAPRLDESLAGDLGMPVPPRGVSGPFSAQLSDPRLPEGLRLIDDTPPPRADFGPGDEFPGAPPPTPVSPPPSAPAAPAATGAPVTDPTSIADLIGEVLYRGVPEGADPMAPNARGFTTWSNNPDVAQQYGPNVGSMPFDPGANIHLGTLEDARYLLGLPPTATAQDIAEAAMRRFAGPNKTASYDLRPELNGVPREFIRFGP